LTMAYQGVVKSRGQDYGFVSCPQTYAQYSRDVFINRSIVGDAVYSTLSTGMGVSFDFGLDEKGQPQATSVIVTNAAAAAPRPPPRQAMQQPYMPQAQSSFGGLPNGTQAVTLHGVPGYFVPASAMPNLVHPTVAAVQYAPPPQQMKRAHVSSYQPPAAPMKRARVDGGETPNPGLDEAEPAYIGTVKSQINATTGYGFITSPDVQAQFPGKDVFMHQNHCGWLPSMNLAVGETVTFNFKVNDKGTPEVTHLMRA